MRGGAGAQKENFPPKTITTVRRPDTTILFFRLFLFTINDENGIIIGHGNARVANHN